MNNRLSTITVKPTLYRGVYMRSKTEAKAAAWIESQGWKWVYEPESFLQEKDQYTPDFYIPDIDALIEVKPFEFLSEVQRIRRIAASIKKTFAVISPVMDGFEIVDLYGRLDPCDGIDPHGWGWHSEEPSSRPIAIGTRDARFPCNMIYMGSGCGNTNYNGDCACSR
jgi:hypothetical protein